MLSLPRLPDEYHVKIERAPAPLFFGWNPFADFAASPPTSQQVRDCIPIVVSELTRYPPAFFDRIRLKKVVICDRVGRPPNTVHGIALVNLDAIYVMAGRGPAQENDWRSEVLHHELFHIIDARDGEAYDEQWQALNPDGFSYSQGGDQANVLWKDRGNEGCLCGPGRANMGEDKAYYFSHMVTAYAAVRDLADRDPRVRAKADLMERMMADFSPCFDATFWADARRRSEPYRVQAAEFNGWAADQPRVQAGIDPLNPDRQHTEPFALVRLTRFPTQRRFDSSPGRLTGLAIPWHELIHILYGLPAARCVAPRELAQAGFDVIVALPDGKQDYDPRIWEAARTAFESSFGITLRKEHRETEVYVLKLGPEGTRLLEAAAKRAQRALSAAKFKAFWRRPAPGPFGDLTSVSISGLEIKDGEARFVIRNAPLSFDYNFLESGGLDRPVIDETGFHKPIDVAVPYEIGKGEKVRLMGLAKALGLEVVPARRSIEMTVFERSPATRPQR